MSKLLEPGKYVVAVSGGVDSVVLLHMLHQEADLKLIVAHFDHGIRADSAEDARFVSELAAALGLPYECARVELGPDASEALARKHRYDFLRNMQSKHGAVAIVTAHHQDDVIETAVLNTLRGTKRRGLVSLRSTDDIKRPLLSCTKQQLHDYAREHDLQWREDSTNADTNYLRNKVRRLLDQTLDEAKRQKIIVLLQQIETQNHEIDAIINDYSRTFADNRLKRSEINRMQLPEAYEIVAAWLRTNQQNFDKKTIERLVIGARTLHKGAQIDVQNGWYCLLSKDEIILTRR